MLRLAEANFADAEKEWLFVREMPPDENGLTNEWYGVSREQFEAEALPRMIEGAEGRGLPEGYVPETILFLWDGDRIVGQFRIRHYLCESLRTGAGHIGYYVGKQERGKGYGTEGLRLTLEAARRIVPEDEFYLRVNRDNPASLKVMLKNGGRIVAEDGQKYYVRIPNSGVSEGAVRQYTRLDRIREAVDEQIKAIPDEETKRCAYVHLYGVGLMAALLALARGFDRRTAELAEIAGMLHDLLTYVEPSADTEEHAHRCAEYAREHFLDLPGCFTDGEKQQIYDGIYNHSDKQTEGTPFEEIIKDADAAQHALRNPMEEYFFGKERMQRMMRRMKEE